MRTRSVQLVAGLLVIGMVAIGCSDDTTTSSPSSESPVLGESTQVADGLAPTVTTAPADTVVSDTVVPDTVVPDTVVSDVDAWALGYTGGTPGTAAGAPIKVGYVNQEDFFPENTTGIDAAVAYVNAALGGAAGHPLEIVPCRVTIADDGARCGSQLADDPEIVAVITGTMVFGNRELYDALNGSKPVIVTNGLTGDDFTTTAGQAFTAGSPGMIVGMAGFIREELEGVDVVAVFGENSPASRAASDLLFKPVMDKAGIATTYVGVDVGATADDVRAAIEQAGAETADVFVPLLTVDQCVGVHAAIEALAIDPAVVSSGLCLTSAMADHLAEVGENGPIPDGWYIGGFGYNSFEPDLDSGMLTYVTKVREFGVPAPGETEVDSVGPAGSSFASVMTLTKFINELGVDQLDTASLDSKIRGFTGPMMMQVGPLSCGNQVVLGLPIFVTLCASQIGVQQFVGGRWVSVRDGLNGDPIDVSQL